jgi:hypothetical protein
MQLLIPGQSPPADSTPTLTFIGFLPENERTAAVKAAAYQTTI